MIAHDIKTVNSAERHEQVGQFLRDLYQYRELFWSFMVRDIKVRYKQTALGVIWVLLQPLFLTGAFAVIFGRLAGMPTGPLPLVLFYLAATVPWTTYASAVTQSALSMEANAAVITKVYFPRVVLPGAITCGSFLDYAFGWVLLNAVALIMGYWHWTLLALSPVLILIQFSLALGIGLALAALNAQYRDVKHAMGFLVQAMMLATPVIYPVSKLAVVAPWARQILFLNPMAAVIDTYRTCLAGGAIAWLDIGLSAAMAGIYLLGGLWFFRQMETRMADLL